MTTTGTVNKTHLFDFVVRRVSNHSTIMSLTTHVDIDDRQGLEKAFNDGLLHAKDFAIPLSQLEFTIRIEPA